MYVCMVYPLSCCLPDNHYVCVCVCVQFLASQDHSGPCYDYVDTAVSVEKNVVVLY